jgi:hypothetical protein
MKLLPTTISFGVKTVVGVAVGAGVCVGLDEVVGVAVGAGVFVGLDEAWGVAVGLVWFATRDSKTRIRVTPTKMPPIVKPVLSLRLEVFLQAIISVDKSFHPAA